MADQDKDTMNPMTGQKAGPGVSNSDLSSNTQQRTGEIETAAGSSMPGQANPTSNVGDAARRTLDQAKDYTKDMAGRAKEQGRSMFEEQKDSAARQVDSAAHAFRNTAEQLQGEGQSQTGRYVGMFAEQLESLGGQLRNKNLDSLIRDAEDLGRRSPGVFLAGSVVAGFLLARFLKSSAQHPHGQETSRSDWRSDFSYSGDTSASMSDAMVDTYEPAGSGMGSTSVGEEPFVSGGTGVGGAGPMAGSSTTGSTTPPIGADGTGADDKDTPSSTSTASKPGGNTYGNR